jgi:peptidoglycan biosynthesis protein MviN/MurJ (putative lipid II flippase)
MTPYVMASFPSLSRQIVLESKLFKIAQKSLVPAIAVSSLVAISCYFLSSYIVKYSYGFTDLTPLSLKTIEKSFIGYMPCLIFSSCSLILTNIFFAAKEEKLVFISAVLSVTLNFLGNLSVIYFKGSIVDLAYVTSIVSLIVFCQQVFSLIRIEKEANLWN